MPAIALTDPPLGEGTVTLRALAPIVKRPERDHLPDVCFARLRPAGG